MKFGEIVGIIKGWNSSFPPTLARDIVNEALDFIYNEYNWSFLHKEDYIIIPKMILGIGNLTKYSTTIEISPDLGVIFDNIENNINEVRIAGRQIVIVDGDNQNIVYTIKSYNSSEGTIIIDKPYLGEDKVGANLRIFKNLYPAPSFLVNNILTTDFKKFLFVSDLSDLRNLNLDISFNQLGETYQTRGVNFQRINYGIPNLLTTTGVDNLGNNLYEFYPIYTPTTKDRVYKVLYIRKGRKLEDNDEIPSQISKATLMAACKIKLYEWAEVNKANDIKLQKSNWMALIAFQQSPNNKFGYIENLDKDIRNDEDNFPKAMMYNYYEQDYFDLIADYSYPFYTQLANF